MKTKNKIANFAVIIILFVCSDLVQAESGRYAGEFMAGGGGARPLSMGGAYVSQFGDAWSLFWNPAGLIRITGREVALMHAERFEGVVDYDAGVYAFPTPDGSVHALGVIRLGVNGIPFTNIENPGQPSERVVVDKYVSDGEYAFYAAKAGWMGRMRWGIAPKLVFKHLGSEYRAYGLGVDAGIGGQLFENIPLEGGLSVRDALSTLIAWEQTGKKEIIVPSIRVGISSLIDLPLLEAKFSPAVEISYRNEVFGDSDAAALHIGGEYLVRDVFALRAGSDDGNFTAGGGLLLKSVSVDYAYTGHDYLGDTHRVSLNARWGNEKRN